jgi:hypothetical protein
MGTSGRVVATLAAVAVVLGAASGCRRVDDAPAGWTPPASPELLEVFQPAGGGPVIELRYSGLGAPFRAAIADPALLEPLGAAIRSCVEGGRAVVATWDEPTAAGRLVVSVPATGLKCRGQVGRDGVALLPLDPVLRALGTWQSGLAEGHDGRLATFSVGLHVADARGGLTLWRATGDRVDRCVVLDGKERCAAAPVTTHLRLGAAEGRLTELIGTR